MRFYWKVKDQRLRKCRSCKKSRVRGKEDGWKSALIEVTVYFCDKEPDIMGQVGTKLSYQTIPKIGGGKYNAQARNRNGKSGVRVMLLGKNDMTVEILTIKENKVEVMKLGIKNKQQTLHLVMFYHKAILGLVRNTKGWSNTLNFLKIGGDREKLKH